MPKGGASSLIPVYAGIRDDLDDFLKAFLLLKTQRYIDYKELFNRRGMTQIFNGRSCSAEIIEFNEYLLVYCLPYLEEYVCPKSPRSLEERIFGLYTMYTFFYLQKVDHVVKIRVDPDAARNFRNFMALLLSLQIYDAYAACVKLLNDRAFKNCAFISVKRIIRNDGLSLNRMASQLGIARSTVQSIVKNDLKLKSYKLRRGQYLSDKSKAMRLEKCRKLLQHFQVRRVSDVIWTDEKIFTIEPLPNRQNQRQLLSKDDSMSPKRRLAHNRLFPKSVMVWAGITATGKTPLVFIERNVKINSEVYQKIVLMDNLLPWVTQHFAGGPFILQQDWAPSHGSRSTLAVLEAHFPGFLDKNLWPASSPDLNPMDFSVWGMLEGKIAGKVFATVDDLKAALEVAWASIDDGYLRRTVNSYDLTYFKRFDTDEKVYGVKIRTNLNDPLSGVKEIVNSPIFSKLGLIHKAYMKKKEEVGVKEIKGTPKLKDLQNVCKQILEQNSRRAEFLTGVEETINTDFTMEQVGNRKELRTEIKERAYGHDMLLTRSRRHRTSIPLVMPTDSFDYEMEPIRAPEIVNDDVKHVKPEYTATEGKPSRRIPRRCGRKRKNPSPPPPPPPKKLRGRKSTKKANVREDSDRKVKTEISKRKGKGRKVLEPSIVKKPKSEKTDDSQGILVSTPEPECVANNLATPTRSIIKKRGKTPVTGNRHVSFLENVS
uniref:Uncharacterized protein n=1 Tax=Caenorhabditis japonica TaxID=281687 RepID=A0A8R1DJA8_CAEJA